MPLFSRIFLGAYGALWRAAMPVLKKNARLRDGFAQRLAPPSWPSPDLDSGRRSGPRIWIQAASGGEAWLVHALLRALRALPGGPESLEVVCTTCTRQGMDVLEKMRSDPVLTAASGTNLRIVTAYLPLDVPAFMERAVARTRPDLLVLLETELWPGLLAAAARASVPVVICNGRLTEKSLAGYTWIQGLWRACAPAHIQAISPEDARRFAALFPDACVECVSNMKFDLLDAQPADASGVPSSLPEPLGALYARGAPLLALASVRQEEEELLAALAPDLLKESLNGCRPLLAVAPRHMHRVSWWEERLKRLGMTVVRRSAVSPEQLPGASSADSVLLWDTFGELAALYALADAVFVGGSLAPLGGQNFLEPLAQGCRVCIGPHWKNFAWAGTDLFQAGLVTRADDAQGVMACLRTAAQVRLQGGPAARAGDGSRVRDAFAAWLRPRTGGAEKSAALLLSMLRGNAAR